MEVLDTGRGGRTGCRLGSQWAGDAGEVRMLDVSAKAAGSRAPPEGWSHWEAANVLHAPVGGNGPP